MLSITCISINFLRLFFCLFQIFLLFSFISTLVSAKNILLFIRVSMYWIYWQKYEYFNNTLYLIFANIISKHITVFISVYFNKMQLLIYENVEIFTDIHPICLYHYFHTIRKCVSVSSVDLLGTIWFVQIISSFRQKHKSHLVHLSIIVVCAFSNIGEFVRFDMSAFIRVNFFHKQKQKTQKSSKYCCKYWTYNKTARVSNINILYVHHIHR